MMACIHLVIVASTLLYGLALAEGGYEFDCLLTNCTVKVKCDKPIHGYQLVPFAVHKLSPQRILDSDCNPVKEICGRVNGIFRVIINSPNKYIPPNSEIVLKGKHQVANISIVKHGEKIVKKNEQFSNLTAPKFIELNPRGQLANKLSVDVPFEPQAVEIGSPTGNKLIIRSNLNGHCIGAGCFNAFQWSTAVEFGGVLTQSPFIVKYAGPVQPDAPDSHGFLKIYCRSQRSTTVAPITKTTRKFIPWCRY